MKRSLFLCISFLLFISACSLPRLNLTKKIIEHPQPDIQIDNSYFTELDCFNDKTCLPENLQNLEPPIGYIFEPTYLLGGLDPVYPLALASTVVHNSEEQIESVYVNRCLAQQHIRYLIAVDGEIRLIDTVEQMAALFAPIETADEALSYAIAATGYDALFDLEKSPKLKLYTSPLEETFVSEKDGQYLVHLFDTYLCGCGPHIVHNLDVTVQKDGSIKLSEPVEAFSDPEMDGLCID